MKRTGLLIALLLAGCASAPQLTPWRADAMLPALPATCPVATGPTSPEQPGQPLFPGGITVVRSEDRDVIILAGRSCVMTVDPATGTSDALPTRGDSIAPTMVDATSNGVAFSSSVTGSVRALAADGAITFNFSGLRQPLGLELLPGGAALVAEHDAGRITRLGPSNESRPRLVADGLDGPTDLLVANATQGYVTEARAGRVTRFRLDQYEKATIATGLNRPEGMALMKDGRLAVVEAGLRRLVAVDVATGRTEVLADDLPLGTDATAATTMTDVATAPDGTLFISVAADRTILKVTPRQPAPASR